MAFKGPHFALCVASGSTDKQGHCQVSLAGGPRTALTTGDAFFEIVIDSAFVENALLHTAP